MAWIATATTNASLGSSAITINAQKRKKKTTIATTKTNASLGTAHTGIARDGGLANVKINLLPGRGVRRTLTVLTMSAWESLRESAVAQMLVLLRNLQPG